MECTLAALIACFSWSSLYLETGLSYQNQGAPATQKVAQAWIWENETWRTDWTEHVVYPRKNPYGSVELGYEVRFKSASISLSVSHRSSISNGQDNGVDSINLTTRWYPFR